MANKYQENINNDKNNKCDKNQKTYRNDSELANENSYMVYELNNTFNDKSKDVFTGKNVSKEINSKSENKKSK